MHIRVSLDKESVGSGVILILAAQAKKIHGRSRQAGGICCAGVNSMVKLLRAHGGCLGRNRR